MACNAHGHGTIRLNELAIPFSIESMTAVLIAWYMPKSSLFTMRTRASGENPSSSLDRAQAVAAAGSRASAFIVRQETILVHWSRLPVRCECIRQVVRGQLI